MRKAKLCKNTRTKMVEAWDNGEYYVSTGWYDYALSETSDGVMIYRMRNGGGMIKLGLLYRWGE